MAKASSTPEAADSGTVITSNDEVQGPGIVEVEFVESTLGDGTIVRTYTGVDPIITGKVSGQ